MFSHHRCRFGGGGNDGGLVHSVQKNTVEGQRDSQSNEQAMAQLLPENHPLISVVPGEEEQSGPRTEMGLQFSLLPNVRDVCCESLTFSSPSSRMACRHMAALSLQKHLSCFHQLVL